MGSSGYFPSIEHLEHLNFEHQVFRALLVFSKSSIEHLRAPAKSRSSTVFCGFLESRGQKKPYLLDLGLNCPNSSPKCKFRAARARKCSKMLEKLRARAFSSNARQKIFEHEHFRAARFMYYEHRAPSIEQCSNPSLMWAEKTLLFHFAYQSLIKY